MITRRNIRVKALQVIYSNELAGTIPSAEAVQKALKTKFAQTGSLLNYLIVTTTSIAKYVEIYANQKASKHLPTADDLIINTKLAGNEVLWQLLENKSLDQACNNTNADSMVDAELVKRTFLQLIESTEYTTYINTASRTMQDDVAIMKYILNECILANDDVVNTIEEQFPNYNDDIEMLHILINNAIEKPKQTNFVKLITADKELYANQLVNTYYSKQEYITDYMKPKLNNWDSERVAKLDKIVLMLGIAELLYFETIPVKVTINEYIDIAKDYSTPQSGQFINGILDNIQKELVRDNKLQKVVFKSSY